MRNKTQILRQVLDALPMDFHRFQDVAVTQDERGSIQPYHVKFARKGTDDLKRDYQIRVSDEGFIEVRTPELKTGFYCESIQEAVSKLSEQTLEGI